MFWIRKKRYFGKEHYRKLTVKKDICEYNINERKKQYFG